MEAAAPELYAACKGALACLASGDLTPEMALKRLREAIRSAEQGPLAAKIAHRRNTIKGIAKAKKNGRKLGRPGFGLTRDRRLILGIWRNGSPRDPLRVLAQVLHCSVTTAHKLVRRAYPELGVEE